MPRDEDTSLGLDSCERRCAQSRYREDQRDFLYDAEPWSQMASAIPPQRRSPVVVSGASERELYRGAAIVFLTELAPLIAEIDKAFARHRLGRLKELLILAADLLVVMGEAKCEPRLRHLVAEMDRTRDLHAAELAVEATRDALTEAAEAVIGWLGAGG